MRHRPFGRSRACLPAVPLALLVALWPSSAPAGAVPLGDGDSSPVRIIAPDSATSDCIGDISTPVCAVETLIACEARIQRELCRKAAGPDYAIEGKPTTVCYRVLSMRAIFVHDLDAGRRRGRTEGFDFLAVKVGFVDCLSKRPYEWPRHFVLLPAPDGWWIENWYYPEWDPDEDPFL